MDLLIRKVSPALVGKLEGKAREKGMSREEFLREQLEVIAHRDVLAEHRLSVNNALGDVAKRFERVTIELDNVEQMYVELVHLISFVTEIDLHDMEEFIKQQVKGREIRSD